ncbi:MAG: DUF1385 domain-containing protein [Clostridia bacterium]|nr:DUF1385 domain-containing protein [Clostridia bacterium]
MMKGSTCMATSVRKPNDEITTKLTRVKKPSKFWKLPLIRGIYSLGSAMVTGTKTLMYSAEVLEEAGVEMEKSKFDQWIENKLGDNANSFIIYFSVITAIIFSVGIFIVLPTIATNPIKTLTSNSIVLNLFEGLIRILLFVIYIVLISRMEDIKRVFQYHGAEHKSIHCFENGLELTVENCKPFTTLHPRCGTSFMMFVMVISLLIFSFLGWPNWWMRILSRILFIPIIAGLSYEVLKWAGKSTSSFVKFISVPGLLLQKLTTREPDESQLEVALNSLKLVLEKDQGNDDTWNET